MVFTLTRQCEKHSHRQKKNGVLLMAIGKAFSQTERQGRVFILIKQYEKHSHRQIDKEGCLYYY
jgi:hypothetical protein